MISGSGTMGVDAEQEKSGDSDCTFPIVRDVDSLIRIYIFFNDIYATHVYRSIENQTQRRKSDWIEVSF